MQEKELKCTFCSMTFKTSNELIEHKKMHKKTGARGRAGNEGVAITGI